MAAFDVYSAAPLWGGQPMDVETGAAGAYPPAGMALPEVHNLNIDIANGVKRQDVLPL